MLKLLDDVFRSLTLSLKFDNFSLNSLVFKTFCHQFTYEQLLLLNQTFELLLLFLVFFVLLFNQFVCSINLVGQLLVEVSNALISMFLAFVFFVILVDLFGKLFAIINSSLDFLLKLCLFSSETSVVTQDFIKLIFHELQFRLCLSLISIHFSYVLSNSSNF